MDTCSNQKNIFSSQQKLVEQLLKRVEAGSRRELYYWHAYYVSFINHCKKVSYAQVKFKELTKKKVVCLQEKRLPAGTSALLKLEGNIPHILQQKQKKVNLNYVEKKFNNVFSCINCRI